MTYVLLIVGFVLLTFCADWLVDGASAIAKRFHISDLIIGLTIVAFGTSMPEFVVSLFASLGGSNEIAMTNVLGSNTLNTLVILGLTALVCPIKSSIETIRFEVPLSILAAMFVMVLGSDCFSRLVGADGFEGVEWWNGLLLLAAFLFFMGHSVNSVINNRKERMAEDVVLVNKPVEELMKPWKAVVLVIVGLVGLTAGGKLIVDNAVEIAKSWGVSEAVIGVTIVALGTSLPELATSVVAAAKKNTDLAIGNVVGSNIFNIFFILGVSSLIKPLPSYGNLLIDSAMALASGMLLLAFLLDDKDKTLSRWEGAVMLALYVGYVVVLIYC